MRKLGAVLLALMLCLASQAALAEVSLLKTLDEQIKPDQTALLIIDMQNDYVADKGKLGKLGLNVKLIQDAVPTMNKLIQAARKAGVMVVWIRQTHTLIDALPNYLASNVARKKGQPFKESDFLVQGGTWGAKFYDKMIDKLPSELEVRKYTYSAFQNTPLETYLKAKGIKTIISIGCVTNVCVQSTAMVGWFNGYYSIISSDAAATTDPELQKATLKNHRIFYGFTPTTEEIIKIWNK